MSAATTTTLLQPGDVLGGFRVEDVIGIGGMAIVYRAVQVSLGRPVALKVLSSKLTADETFRERFRREGTHAASLEHPNIVPVYDSGEDRGLLYLAMRLVEGTNLAELIQTRGLTADQTIELLRPVASALDTAHAAGLIHRDIKPQNILITSQGHPYLADFGVAKGSNTQGLTVTGNFVGSVNYASPEQIKGLTLTPASDVYALTAVLYQCLTGEVPYPRETDAGIMQAHLSEPPPTLPKRAGMGDSDFHTVLARGMAKDPGSRYGHAGDLMNAAGLSVSRLPAAMRKAVPAFPRVPPSGDSSAVGGAVSRADAAGSPDAQQAPAGGAPANLRDATDLTTADRRRAPAPPQSTPERSRRIGRRSMVAILAIAAIATTAVAASLLASPHAKVHRLASAQPRSAGARRQLGRVLSHTRKPTAAARARRARRVASHRRAHSLHRRAVSHVQSAAQPRARQIASPTPQPPVVSRPTPAPAAPPPAERATPAPTHRRESQTVVSAPK